MFCPVNLRLISCRALGSLDTSSGGAMFKLGDVFTAGRTNRLPFILRWDGLKLNEWVLGLKPEGGTMDSTMLIYSRRRKEKTKQ